MCVIHLFDTYLYYAIVISKTYKCSRRSYFHPFFLLLVFTSSLIFICSTVGNFKELIDRVK